MMAASSGRGPYRSTMEDGVQCLDETSRQLDMSCVLGAFPAGDTSGRSELTRHEQQRTLSAAVDEIEHLISASKGLGDNG